VNPPTALSRARADALTFAGWTAGVLARWRIVARVTGAALLLAALATVVLPPVYRGEASFVANGSGGLKLPGGLSGTNAIAGIASQFGVATGAEPSESPAFYDQLLESRELLTRLLESKFGDPRTASPTDSATLLDLLEIRNKDRKRALEIGIKRMRRAMDVRFDSKTNLVWLTVDAEWPDVSAAVANRAVELVNRFNLEQRQTRARAKRAFIEERRTTSQAELDRAEARLRAFYDENRLWRQSPSLTFDEGQLRRQVEIASDLFLTLQRQYEAARIDEFNDAAMITTVDTAVAPRRAQWPRYGLAFVTAALVGAFLGLLAAGVATVLADWARRDPDAAAQFRRMGARVRGGWRPRARAVAGTRPSRVDDDGH
jgi:uncharacterized protein involved in exopolysaccharide biosynthesis